MKVLKLVVWGALFLVSTGPAKTHTVLQYEDSSSRDSCKHCCIGYPGTHGIPGKNGERGLDGRLGTKGEMGQPGMQGYPGERGEVGPAGLKGHRGRKGTKGECGSTGLPGIEGAEGPPGMTGPPGPPGKRGPKGAHPGRIAFTVKRGENLGPVPRKTPVSFDEIHINIGDGFDSYSSHFICKVPGVYLFTVSMLSMENQTAYGWIMHNKQPQMAFHGDANALYGTGSNTIILKLVKEDHVWVQLEKNSAIMNSFSSFSGHILFED